jgi:hypothetical protein
MQAILDPTCAFISLESFRELFWLLDDGAIGILHSQLLNELARAMQDFKSAYSAVTDRLLRIRDSPIATPCAQVYARFEGAYRSFLLDQNIMALFDIMAQIGNVIAVSEMMDDALFLKRQSGSHSADFFFNRSPKQPPVPVEESDFFSLFDQQFNEVARLFTHVVDLPTNDQIIQPFLLRAVQEIARAVLEAGDLFNEQSGNLMDVLSLTGFASKWSVLDFIFSLIESGKRTGGERGAIARFGEGVHLCAAVVLCATGQVPLFRAFGIGERILSHFETDFSSGGTGQRIKDFIVVNKLVSSAYQCAISVLRKTVEVVLAPA